MTTHHPTPGPTEPTTPLDDLSLRAWMQQTTAAQHHPQQQALEDRILAQWALRDHRGAGHQPVGSGLLAMDHAPVPFHRWALGAVLAVAVLAVVLGWQARLLDATGKDLVDIDVLSLMAEGEL
ncbi:MAG: hypothetical protein RJA09_1862 [Pseudomonadota bacterium]